MSQIRPEQTGLSAHLISRFEFRIQHLHIEHLIVQEHLWTFRDLWCVRSSSTFPNSTWLFNTARDSRWASYILKRFNRLSFDRDFFLYMNLDLLSLTSFLSSILLWRLHFTTELFKDALLLLIYEVREWQASLITLYVRPQHQIFRKIKENLPWKSQSFKNNWCWSWIYSSQPHLWQHEFLPIFGKYRGHVLLFREEDQGPEG